MQKRHPTGSPCSIAPTLPLPSRSARNRNPFYIQIVTVAGFLGLGLPGQALAVELTPADSVQAAIDAAAPGTVLQLGSGTFSQSLRLRDGVSLQGAGVGQTLISASITIPASVVGGVNLADLSLTGVSSAGSQVVMQRVEVGGTLSLEGAGSTLVEDSTLRWYYVTRGTATATFRRINGQNAGFTWEQGQATYEDSSFTTYFDLQSTSRTTFRRCQLRGAYLTGAAQAWLEDVTSAGTLSVAGTSRATVLDSALSSLSWSENGGLTMERSSAGYALVTISAGVEAALDGVGPGLMTTAGAEAPTGFSGSLLDTRFDSLALDVYGSLDMLGGGFNAYSFVRTAGQAHLDSVVTAQLLRLVGGAQVAFEGSTLGADVEVLEQSQARFAGTLATAGTVTVKDQAEALVAAGSQLRRVYLSGQGSLEVADAGLSKLELHVDSGLAALIDGLKPGTGQGATVVPGPVGGPELTLQNGNLGSVMLWVLGEADVLHSDLDDYGIVESSGIGRFQDVTFRTFGLFRDTGLLTCLNCVSGPSAILTVAESARATFEGGLLRNSFEVRDTASAELLGVSIGATVIATGQGSLRVSGSLSTAHTLQVQGQSQVSVEAGSSLYGAWVSGRGRLTAVDSSLGTLTLDVAAGNTMKASGLAPGLLNASAGPVAEGDSGPRAGLSQVQVNSISVLNRGSLEVLDSVLTGYTWMYENSQARFERTQLKGVTYFLAGSRNLLQDASVEGLFNINGSVNQFVGTRVASGASVYIGGASSSTFTYCQIERGLTLEGQSQANFGDGAANPGRNDFSLITGYFKLANRTTNPVSAQHNFWGSEDVAQIAGWIIDQQDDAAYGLVNWEPFARLNTPPSVEAGEDRYIASVDQDSLVLLGSALDPDGDVLTYRWLEGEEALTEATLVEPDGTVRLDLSQVIFFSAGDHFLTLEVTEENGVVVTDGLLLTVGNTAPVVTANGGGSIALGDPLVIAGEVADFDGDVLAYEWWLGEELLFQGSAQTVVGGEPVLLPEHVLAGTLPLGSHTLRLAVTDGVNERTWSSIVVDVMDMIPPVLSPVAEPSILWPPDGRMRSVRITTYAMDASGGSVQLRARVTSNEGGTGCGWYPDWTEPVIDQANGIITLKLRAELNFWNRSRIYTVWITAKDASGNQSESRVEIKVPRWTWWWWW